MAAAVSVAIADADVEAGEANEGVRWVTCFPEMPFRADDFAVVFAATSFSRRSFAAGRFLAPALDLEGIREKMGGVKENDEPNPSFIPHGPHHLRPVRNWVKFRVPTESMR